MLFLVTCDFVECTSYDSSDIDRQFELVNVLPYTYLNVCYRIHSKTGKKMIPAVEYFSKIHNRRYAKCGYCDVNFLFPNKYYLHMRYHSGGNKFCCYRCNVHFPTRADLDLHKLIHKDKIKYQCKPCSKMFRSGIKLRKHLNNFHSVTMKYICKYCTKVLITEQEMSNHRLDCFSVAIGYNYDDMNGYPSNNLEYNQQVYGDNNEQIMGELVADNGLSLNIFVLEQKINENNDLNDIDEEEPESIVISTIDFQFDTNANLKIIRQRDTNDLD